LTGAAHALTNVRQYSDQGNQECSHVKHLLSTQIHILVKDADVNSANEQELEGDKSRHAVWSFVHGQDEIGVLVKFNFGVWFIFVDGMFKVNLLIDQLIILIVVSGFAL
jgi:hypothetical protein